MPTSKAVETVPVDQPTLRKSSILKRGERLLRRYYDWKNIHQYLGRYSTDKLLSFDEYRQTTSVKRVLVVSLLTPVPGIVIMLMLAAIPLNNPLLGATKNATYFIQSSMSYTVMSFSSSWLSSQYTGDFRSLFEIYWGSRPSRYSSSFSLGRRLRHYTQSIACYLPLLFAQSSTLVIFQAIAIAFQNVPGWAQATIAVLFPVHRCDAVCGGAIWFTVSKCVHPKCSAPVITAIIVFVDISQAVLETRMYLQHKFIVDGRQATQTAVIIIEGGRTDSSNNPKRWQGSGKSERIETLVETLKGHSVTLFSADAWTRFPKDIQRGNFRRASSKIACLAPGSDALNLVSIQSLPFSSPSPVPVSTPKMAIDDIELSHREHAKLLSQTLQLVFASEVLVFAEYSELVCAVLYSIYTLCLYHTPYAKYNLSFIGLSDDTFWASLTNSAVYAVFEGLTLLLLFILPWTKYGLSTFYQLAFVLCSWMGVQGKVIGSLSLIFILNTVHHGTFAHAGGTFVVLLMCLTQNLIYDEGMDLSLSFDWEKVLNGTAR